MRQRHQMDVNSAERFCSELDPAGVASACNGERDRQVGPVCSGLAQPLTIGGMGLTFAWIPLNSSNASGSRLPSVS